MTPTLLLTSKPICFLHISLSFIDWTTFKSFGEWSWFLFDFRLTYQFLRRSNRSFCLRTVFSTLVQIPSVDVQTKEFAPGLKPSTNFGPRWPVLDFDSIRPQ